jgi:hypothetical protein
MEDGNRSVGVCSPYLLSTATNVRTINHIETQVASLPQTLESIEKITALSMLPNRLVASGNAFINLIYRIVQSLHFPT